MQLYCLLFTVAATWHFARSGSPASLPPCLKPTDQNCLVPYDGVQGTADGNVLAYSNGNDTYFSGETHFFHGLFMGLKWQCVEFARRWLVLRRGVIFGSIDTAAEMFQGIHCMEGVTDGKVYPVQARRNGWSQPPSEGALLIYSTADDAPVGHVAVITQVLTDTNRLRLAEQNWSFQKWVGNFNREVVLMEQDGGYWVQDGTYHVAGWLEVIGEDMNPITIDVLGNKHAQSKYAQPFSLACNNACSQGSEMACYSGGA